MRRTGNLAFATLFATGVVALAFLWAATASGESLPGPPLERASEPGAYCLPQGDSAGLGGAGFAGAVTAIAFVARRRRDPA
jgi:hypothetical protein